MRKLKNAQRSLFSQWPDHHYSQKLSKFDKIIDSLPDMLQWVSDDLKMSLKAKSGAHGMTVEQLLRADILKQVNQWSFHFLALQCIDMLKNLWLFQKLRNYRAGIDSVISYLKRCFGLGKALWKGAEGFAALVSSGIVAYILTCLSKLI